MFRVPVLWRAACAYRTVTSRPNPQLTNAILRQVLEDHLKQPTVREQRLRLLDEVLLYTDCFSPSSYPEVFANLYRQLGRILTRQGDAAPYSFIQRAFLRAPVSLPPGTLSTWSPLGSDLGTAEGPMLSVYGSLFLTGAMAASRAEDRPTTRASGHAARRRARSGALSPRARTRPASSALSSTAPVTCSTDASRPSPRAPAKEDCSFEPGC